jgi:predicted Zn-dependent protease
MMEESYAQFETFLAKGVLPSAEAVARHMYSRGPTEELPHVAQARLLMARGQHAAAIALLRKLDPAANGMGVALGWIGEAYAQMGQEAEADRRGRWPRRCPSSAAW